MGKKFIIEIEDDPFIRYECFPGEEKLYIAKGFNSLVFDENGLDKLTPYDESAAELRGAEKAWELAKKISIMPNEAKKEVWGTDKYNTINLGYSYAEAAERYEVWQKKKTDDAEITVGDEVRCGNIHGIVLQVTEKSITVINTNGYVAITDDKREWGKTGRHFSEVAELLKKIGGNG